MFFLIIRIEQRAKCLNTRPLKNKSSVYVGSGRRARETLKIILNAMMRLEGMDCGAILAAGSNGHP